MQTIMAALTAALLVSARPMELTQEAPAPGRSEAFCACARKALEGRYGNLADWQREGYTEGLREHRAQVLVLTAYLGTEASGKRDCRGRRCTLRTAASNRIAQGAWVWTERTGIRQVRDRGGRGNDRRAARMGGTWVDVWYPTGRAARAAGVDGWVRTAGAVMGP
jgi:hypothetical protein